MSGQIKKKPFENFYQGFPTAGPRTPRVTVTTSQGYAKPLWKVVIFLDWQINVRNLLTHCFCVEVLQPSCNFWNVSKLVFVLVTQTLMEYFKRHFVNREKKSFFFCSPDLPYAVWKKVWKKQIITLRDM